MKDRIFGIWDEFVDGLVDAFAAIEGYLRRRAHLRLLWEDEAYLIERENGRRSRLRLRLERSSDGNLKLFPERLAKVLKGRDVDLVLRSDEVLVRTLDPLPAESRPYLDGIVRHHLERLMPWRVDDVLHAYRVSSNGPNDPRLVVTIIATARSIQNRVLDALRELKPAGLSLLYRDELTTEQGVAIAIDGNAQDVTRRTRLKRFAIINLALASLMMVAAATVLSLALKRADKSLGFVTFQTTELRRNLVAQVGARGAGRGASGATLAILNRKRESPTVVLALEALSNVLPDDTWLTELRYSEGRVRLSGVSRNVATLVPLIASSHNFADANFFAPTTRIPGGEGDRFSIEARLVPLGGGQQ